MSDITGKLLNEYAGSRRLDFSPPDTPWAMYLAGADRRYRFLAFDLDAKGAHSPGDADRDARAIAEKLNGAGVPTVVCESGPSGGRHVWAGLADSLDAATVATLARLFKHSHPTLDIAPLTNPVTGCVRPPGSPHRHGGASTVLSGLLNTLTAPTATADQIRSLVTELATDMAPEPPARAAGPLPVDDHGRLYLPGAKRALPAASQQALAEDAASADASAVLWRVLIGAASAHWRFADIASLASTAPGLEHIRTTRSRAARTPRSATDALAVLRRQWDKAVRWVSTTTKQIGGDPSFDPRADALAAYVRGLQERADASRGRWSSGTGPSDRRVLDVLCLLCLQAMSTDIEADTRRIALMAGISRDTSSKALHRLSRHGWIVRTHPSEGPRAAHWSIDPQKVLHRDGATSLTQADPRPAGVGSAERTTLLALLTSRVEAARHDVFTPGSGFGLLAGNLYARLGLLPKTFSCLSRELGLSTQHATALLGRLEGEGLAVSSSEGWMLPSHDRRGPVAATRGVSGRLAARAARYRLERQVWAWWLSERAWMSAPRGHKPSPPLTGRLRALEPVAGLNSRGRYPRFPSGRGNHYQAWAVVAAGTQRSAGAAPVSAAA